MIGQLLTALIFATLSRKVVSGTVAYLLFSTLPTALVLSLNIDVNKTISCSLLAISIPVKGAVSDLQCDSLGKYAQMISGVLLIASLTLQYLVYVKLDRWKVRGRGTLGVPRDDNVEFVHDEALVNDNEPQNRLRENLIPQINHEWDEENLPRQSSVAYFDSEVIRLSKIVFRYNTNSDIVINNMNLTVIPG